MSTATAKAFRQQVLKPAEGVFLFHPRAVERLIEEQLGEHLQGHSVPVLPYYLMPREAFLYGLETENAEALSVIEGLRLPSYVVLLPSPTDQWLEEHSFNRLRHEYWARTFEAEIARSWQVAREDNNDSRAFGAEALRALIGEHAFREVRDVLERDGMTLSIWDDDLICRSFVATVARLRYFAAGARGFFFPAIRVWPQVDEWMAASGLDLPEPLAKNRLPMLLLKSRPGSGGDLPPGVPLLPTALPFGSSDPDLPRAIEISKRPLIPPPSAVPPEPLPLEPDEDGVAAMRELEQHYLAALRIGSVVRRRSRWSDRLRWQVELLRRRLVRRVLLLPGIDDVGFTGGLRRLGVALFEQAIAEAQRAEFEGRFALALRYLAEARRIGRRLNPPGIAIPSSVERAIAEREQGAETHLADLLAAKWKLDPRSADELGTLIGRLAAEDRRPYGSAPARSLLANLEKVLAETGDDYFRLRLLPWVATFGRAQLRQALPFQALLRALRALEAARARLEDILWPIADLERFERILGILNSRITARLDAQITPRVEQAMREADFVPRNHRERVAAHKMKLELLDVIKRRRHLKFTDVRDIVARNILRLPDPTLDEFYRGDRLRRFDRTAAKALPGVYRPGEIYIKGLQQLGAPLFGTATGRTLLRHLILPLGGGYLLVKSLDLLIGLLPYYERHFHFTNPESVILIGGVLNTVLYTGVGRHVGLAVWNGLVETVRFVLYDGVRRLLRWEPIARALKTGLLRGLARNVVQPLLIGVLPLVPIIALAVFVEEVPIKPGLWLLGLAFALGTLARNTPAGRRFLDDLSTSTVTYLRRLNQALFIGLIQQLLYFFKEVTRRFAQLLHRVDEALTHRLDESWPSLLAKAVLAPVWRLAEALIQFYVNVLVEPQINPVKHFPIVSIGHKLLLPFLPAITTAMVDITDAVLPKVISYPLVTLTIVLLPGLFGFLVWELKENWKLYQANHRAGLKGADVDQATATAAMPVEPAIVGSHGESMRGLMSRGFHSGTLPKGFDRLRKVIRDEVRDEIPYPKRLRRAQRQLDEVQLAICVFFDREFTYALRERCRDPGCTLERIETHAPTIATNLVELRAEIWSRPRDSAPGEGLLNEPVQLCMRLSHQAPRISFETELGGATETIGSYCRSLISDDLLLFAGRAGADVASLDPGLPWSAAAGSMGGAGDGPLSLGAAEAGRAGTPIAAGSKRD